MHMMLALMSALTSVFLTGDAAAGGTTGGGLSGLFDAGLQVAGFAFDLFDLVVAHPILAAFVGVGLIYLAAGVIGRLAGVSKSIA